MQRIVDHPFFLWALIALPSIPMVLAIIDGGPGPDGQSVYEMLLHPTGEFAARFMIAAMLISPFRLIFPHSRFWFWMLKRRRYFGVAAFAYAALHTVLYVVDMVTLQAMLAEVFALGIWTGWLALFIFLPLAIASNDWSVRTMGRYWKPLQRLIYVAALATLLHWIFVHNNLGPALAHFAPLAALEAYRIWKNLTPNYAARRP